MSTVKIDDKGSSVTVWTFNGKDDETVQERYLQWREKTDVTMDCREDKYMAPSTRRPLAKR